MRAVLMIAQRQVLRSVEEWTSQKIVFWLYRRVVINICNSYLWSSKLKGNRMKMWNSSHKRMLIGLWMLFLQRPFFRGLSSVEEQMLSWYTEFALGCMFIVEPSPALTSEFSPKRSSANAINICRHDTALQKLNSLPLLHSANSPIPITLASSLPNALPCFHTAFTRRTIGHCLGTFTAVNFSDPPVIIIIIIIIKVKFTL
jgi:hypothetical protein